MKTKLIILIILIVTSGVFYYNINNQKMGDSVVKNAIVARVIDGDTVVLGNGIRIRLLGINTPEKNMSFDIRATVFLRKMIQNKTVKVESHGLGKYGRTLAYLFLDGKNVNEEMLSQGLATLYYYKPDKYYNSFVQAEKSARLSGKNYWEKSPDSECIKVVLLKVTEPEKLILKNLCDKKLSIYIKDSARHTYYMTIKPDSEFTKTFSHIWNNDGDTLYVRDAKGLLTFYRYS